MEKYDIFHSDNRAHYAHAWTPPLQKEFRIKYKIDNESDDLLRELTNKAIKELKEKYGNEIQVTNVHMCTTKYGIELFFGKWLKRNENKIILKGE